MKLIDGKFNYGETVAIDVDGKLYKRKVHYDIESGAYVNIDNHRVYEKDISGDPVFDRNAYVQTWIREKKDKISVLAPKGTKDAWRSCAADLGMSLNAFIIYCVENEIHGR